MFLLMTDFSYIVPFAVDLLRVDGGVGVGAGDIHMVGLHNLGDLVVDAQDGLTLLVCLWQRGFELLVGRAQALRRIKIKCKPQKQKAGLYFNNLLLLRGFYAERLCETKQKDRLQNTDLKKKKKRSKLFAQTF